MSAVIIRLIIAIAIWGAIIWLHLRCCEKKVWLAYDIQCRTTTDDPPLPTRKDLLDMQYSHGGPLIVLPGLNLIIMLACWIDYAIDKADYNEKYHPDKLWENKVLKR